MMSGSPVFIDDFLSWDGLYVSPCEASSADGAVAKLYPNNKSYAKKSLACEEIPKSHRF